MKRYLLLVIVSIFIAGSSCSYKTCATYTKKRKVPKAHQVQVKVLEINQDNKNI